MDTEQIKATDAEYTKMKADKVTVTIKLESLSIDTLRGMLATVADMVDAETESGKLVMSDGDQIEWTTERTPVEF